MSPRTLLCSSDERLTNLAKVGESKLSPFLPFEEEN